ncbi:MAG TPA: glycosyltransferase family 39 protein [Solirubrobacteraceae bacterium]
MAVGTVLRFRGLGQQSFWYDEVATIDVIDGTFRHVFSAVQASESTPPLYYALAYVWRHVFGLSEAGVRSFSALVGTVAIPFVWLAGRELGSRRGGLVAAALVAVNPMLIWYSQESRAYSLVVALTAASLWLMLRALRVGGRRSLFAWTVSGMLLLLTHYFAVFVVVAEAGVLLWKMSDRRRLVAAAIVPIALTGLALVPLARAQERDGRTSWISSSPLGGRLHDVLHELLTANAGLISSNSTSPHGPWGKLGLIAIIAAVVLLVARPLERRLGRSALPLLIGLGSLLIPLALVVVHLDYFKDRNLIAAWIPLSLVLGLVVTGTRVRWLGLTAAAAIVLAGVVVDNEVVNDVYMQRTSWRQALTVLGTPNTTRAVVINPAYSAVILDAYGQGVGPMVPGIPVREIDVIQLTGYNPPVVPTPPGVHLIAHQQVQYVAVYRYATNRPVTYTKAQVDAASGQLFLEISVPDQRWFAAYARFVAQLRGDASAGAGAAALAQLRAAPAAAAALGSPPADIPPTARRLPDRARLAASAAARYADARSAANRVALLDAVK